MKYIRTETNIFEVVGENEKVYKVKAVKHKNLIYSKSKIQTNVIKQADTIEELCDAWIIIPIGVNCNPNCNPFVRYIKEDISHFINDSHIIYGAIWTDKGLIYVAKMNEKGELELL